MPKKVINIDPITRLEGHGTIKVFLDDNGDVEHAYLQVPELRGFEKFLIGRPAEEAARITSRICGVCPTAHHLAATKAMDDLYKVQPPPAALAIREFLNSAFMVEDHVLHFFFLGGPDFVVGPQAAKAERNILGVIAKAGLDAGKKVITLRKEVRDLMQMMGGKTIHPVYGLPGGVSKAVTPEAAELAIKTADHAIEFGKWMMELFNQIVLGNEEYVKLILSEPFQLETYYMGTVDKDNKLNHYDGHLRVVDQNGKEFARFDPKNYLDFVCEQVEPWTYIRPTYLKPIGWKGYEEGPESGIYRVNCLARLNASEGMATPLAQAEHDRMYSVLGDKPVHATLAWHWARIIEAIYAAERMKELAISPEFRDSNVRTIPTATPTEGIGCIEAPRGTLMHHYWTDENGIITEANLIVATAHNAAAMTMGIDKAAKGLIKGGGDISEGVLNMVEMTYRAYDPCIACATHTLSGDRPFAVEIFDKERTLIRRMK